MAIFFDLLLFFMFGIMKELLHRMLVRIGLRFRSNDENIFSKGFYGFLRKLTVQNYSDILGRPLVSSPGHMIKVKVIIKFQKVKLSLNGLMFITVIKMVKI